MRRLLPLITLLAACNDDAPTQPAPEFINVHQTFRAESVDGRAVRDVRAGVAACEGATVPIHLERVTLFLEDAEPDPAAWDAMALVVVRTWECGGVEETVVRALVGTYRSRTDSIFFLLPGPHPWGDFSWGLEDGVWDGVSRFDAPAYLAGERLLVRFVGEVG